MLESSGTSYMEEEELGMERGDEPDVVREERIADNEWKILIVRGEVVEK